MQPQRFFLNYLKILLELIVCLRANDGAALPSLSPASPSSTPPVIYKIGLSFCWHSGLCEVGIFFCFWLHGASVFLCFRLSAPLLSPHQMFPTITITSHSVEAHWRQKLHYCDDKMKKISFKNWQNYWEKKRWPCQVWFFWILWTMKGTFCVSSSGWGAV